LISGIKRNQELEDRKEGQLLRYIRRFFGKKIAVVAVTYILIFYSAGVFADLLPLSNPNQQTLSLEARTQPPSGQHLLGTDRLGRDLLSRVIYSARTTIIFTTAVIITGSLFIGLTLGLIAGYKGGWLDSIIMRVGETLSGIPTLFLLIAISAAFRTYINDLGFWFEENTFFGESGPVFVDFLIIVSAVVPFAWIGASRIVRSQVLAIREQEYILAAEAIAASTWRIIWKHIFPGVVPLFLVGLSASMAGIAGTEVALSWLGLGVDPPTASFGTLLNEAGGIRTFSEFPHLLLAPAIPVILFFFAWNLLGDALVDLAEPRTVRA